MQLHSIQDELEGFRAEAEMLLSGLRRGRPAECALLKAFGGAPHTGAVEVEQFQPGMGFVDKEMQPAITKPELEVIFHDVSKAVEALA